MEGKGNSPPEPDHVMALCGAAAGAQKDRLARLLADGLVDVRTNLGAEQSSPLHFAVIGGSKEVIDLLLLYDADINVRDAKGATPLYDAVVTNRADLVEHLLARGADPGVKLNDGRSLLKSAIVLAKQKPEFTRVRDLILATGVGTLDDMLWLEVANDRLPRLNEQAGRYDGSRQELIAELAQMVAYHRSSYAPCEAARLLAQLGHEAPSIAIPALAATWKDRTASIILRLRCLLSLVRLERKIRKMT